MTITDRETQIAEIAQALHWDLCYCAGYQEVPRPDPLDDPHIAEYVKALEQFVGTELHRYQLAYLLPLILSGKTMARVWPLTPTQMQWAVDAQRAARLQAGRKPTDTRLERTHTANMSNNPSAPKQGPTRCRNCNQPTKGHCRKCRPQHNIKTR